MATQATRATNQSQTAIPLTGLRALAQRHPITLFLAVAFGLGYPVMSLVILVQNGVIPGAAWLESLGIPLETAMPLLGNFLALFPAAILVTTLEGGRPALRALFRRVFRWRFGLVWWLVAVVALPATTVVLATLLGDSLRMPSAAVLGGEILGIAVAFVLINLWEETAWAGFLQTRLERRHNFYLAALLTALPFAAIHLPLQVFQGTTTPAGIALAFGLLTLFGVVMRSLMGIVMRGAGNSILAAGLMHALFNASNSTDGIAADFLAGPYSQTPALIATALLTVVVGLAIRRRLSRAHRQELDARNHETLVSRGDPSLSTGHAGTA